MAITEEQLRSCTVGLGNVLPTGLSGNLARDKTLAGVTGSRGDYSNVFIDQESAQSSLVQNLVSLPGMIEEYNKRDTTVSETPGTFAYEDPTLVNFQALEPTSGRKQWKLRHHKSIKKKEKAFKNGFQGS